MKIDGRCMTCNHGTHDAGRCKQCNCGESEVVHGRYGANHHSSEVDYANRINGIYQAGGRGQLRGERNYHTLKKAK